MSDLHDQEAAERSDLLRRLDLAAGDPIGREIMGAADLPELRDFVIRVEDAAARTVGRTHIQAMWDLDSEQTSL